jgi:hypothetical protein
MDAGPFSGCARLKWRLELTEVLHSGESEKRLAPRRLSDDLRSKDEVRIDM